ncbi:CinA family protein [Pannonibacter phragmitetus]|uniref:CinA family protein n=1 Tax=Pannonibacter phragmitetus TaxID=121719 RepID=UPI003D2F10CF
MTDLTHLRPQAEALVLKLKGKGLMMTAAESCTGGLVCALITEIPGSSTVLDRGFVTYSNEAKMEMLGVPAAVLGRVGAVSEETARAMAEGALSHSRADVSVSITGIAGPGGGSAEKPVGLVHFAAAGKGKQTRHLACQFGDRGRDGIRALSAATALELLSNLID